MSRVRALTPELRPLLREMVRRVMLGEVAVQPEVLNGVLVRALTRREREVFYFLGEGLSASEQSRRMRVQEGTLRVYACQVRGKLGLEPPELRRAAQRCWAVVSGRGGVLTKEVGV